MPFLKIVLNFQIHPLIVPNAHGASQITGLKKNDSAGKLDGIRIIVLSGKYR